MNSQHKNTNPKGYFVFRKLFEMFVLKISGIQKKSNTQIFNQKNH